MNQEKVISCFSMEVALLPDIPTYSDGLRLLAGYSIGAATDLGIPMVAGSLLHMYGLPLVVGIDSAKERQKWHGKS